LTSEHLFDSVLPPFGAAERPAGRGDAVLTSPLQTTLDLGVPLSEVTFCVVDLETTGGSPAPSRITEIGAVKVRGGERLATFGTLVDPREPIPPFVSHLTGITDQLVAGEPSIEQVLPALVEFLSGSVFVAHNAGFDFGFIDVALRRLDYPPIPGPPVCTAKLAKRVVWPDVPNVRLPTLARYFRTRTQPNHRALADALPRGPGVYVFRARDGRVLYVGKSTDLRTRVRSYFYGDARKKVERLLAEVCEVEGITCASELEALVLEARLIGRHEPPYNRRGKTWRRYAYLKIDPSEAFPRLKIARDARTGDGCTYLGPFANGAAARLAKEALEEVLPIRRCTTAMTARTRFAPCALADIGRCLAPCDGRTDLDRYGELVRRLLSSLQAPGELLGALEVRMSDLAAQERFEEASLVRDRLRALAEGLARARQDRWLVGAGTMALRTAGGTRILISGGTVVGADGASPMPLPCPRDRADELAAVRSWLARNPVRVELAQHPPAEPVEGGLALARVLIRVREAARDTRAGSRTTPR
jgi:DNA polymerase-3 subunit epsilon